MSVRLPIADDFKAPTLQYGLLLLFANSRLLEKSNLGSSPGKAVGLSTIVYGRRYAV